MPQPIPLPIGYTLTYTPACRASTRLPLDFNDFIRVFNWKVVLVFMLHWPIYFGSTTVNILSCFLNAVVFALNLTKP